jgi:hypothetical protein
MNIKTKRKKEKKLLDRTEWEDKWSTEVYNNIYRENNLVHSIWVSNDGITYAHVFEDKIHNKKFFRKK